MRFWDIVKELVGHIPVVGTVKDAIEAGIDEAKGHTGEARARIIEAGVSLLGDLLTGATYGIGAHAALAGMEAAEKVIVNGAAEFITEDALGITTRNANKAKLIINAAEAAMRAKRKEAPRKIDPKPGHHVINSGVTRIYQDILDAFFEQHPDIFFGKTYSELKTARIINETSTPELIASYENSLPADVAALIQEMIASTPASESHTGDNDITFGITKTALLSRATVIMHYVFLSLKLTEEMPDVQPLSSRPLHLLDVHPLNRIVDFITREPFGGVYVDGEALVWWLAHGGQWAQFIRCRDEVRNMFNSLGKPTIIWGKQIFDTHQRLYAMVTEPGPHHLLSLNMNPIFFVQNSSKTMEPPDNAIKLGYQGDWAGDHWCAVAETEWGMIPGKAKGNKCWYPYDCKEFSTDNFSWLTSMRPVKLVANTDSGVPQSAIQCGYQDDGAGCHYAAIAETSWGRIPGKAKDSTCWYPIGGKEYYTSKFDWVVRG